MTSVQILTSQPVAFAAALCEVSDHPGPRTVQCGDELPIHLLEARDDLLLELFKGGDSRRSDEIPHLRVLGND